MRIGRQHYKVELRDALRGNQLALGPESRVIKESDLLSALGRPYHGYHPRIHDKAAALVHAVIRNHAFVDGNKRTALFLLELLLERSGYRLKASDRELSGKLILVAEGNMEYDALKEWLEPRIARLDR